MSESSIEWTNYTGGPWLICTEVSPGCVNCYSRKLMEKRLANIVREAYRKANFPDWETREVWGKTAPRVLSKGFWEDVYRVNRKFAGAVERPKWFPSLIDWLDDMPAGIIDQDGNWLDAVQVLADFLKVIKECQNIDFLLLSKRVEKWHDRIIAAQNLSAQKRDWQLSTWLACWLHGTPPQNVMVGASIEDNGRRGRILDLIQTPAKHRFISCEPMLEEVDFGLSGIVPKDISDRFAPVGDFIDVIIFGGESEKQSKCRPCNIADIRSGIKQCRAAGVKVFVKQLGSVCVTDEPDSDNWPAGTEFDHNCTTQVLLKDPKGGDMAEWPEDVRIREFPGSDAIE